MKNHWMILAAVGGIVAAAIALDQAGGCCGGCNGGCAGCCDGGFLSRIAHGIAKAEGVNPCYNNPLAITGPACGKTGTFNSAGVDTFDTACDGWAAGISRLSSWITRFPDLTLGQLLTRWVQGPNNMTPNQCTQNYICNVSKSSGIPACTRVGCLGGC